MTTYLNLPHPAGGFHLISYYRLITKCSELIPVAEHSKVWVCSCSPVGIAGSNPAVGIDVCLLRVLCVCQVEVSATC
jgi:hypothetical protein